jgi:hypothetical protein
MQSPASSTSFSARSGLRSLTSQALRFVVGDLRSSEGNGRRALNSLPTF